MTYSDVLAMPTYERRYFLGLLTKQAREREEEMEEMKEKTQVSSGKGNRTTTPQRKTNERTRKARER